MNISISLLTMNVQHLLEVWFHFNDTKVILHLLATFLHQAGCVLPVFSRLKYFSLERYYDTLPAPDLSSELLTLVSRMPNIEEIGEKGCSFYSRCPERIDSCLKAPQLISLKQGHLASCHLYQNEGSESHLTNHI